MTKHCWKCKTTQPETEFYGKKSRCKLCIQAEARERYWRDPDTRRQTARAYKARTSGLRR